MGIIKFLLILFLLFLLFILVSAAFFAYRVKGMVNNFVNGGRQNGGQEQPHGNQNTQTSSNSNTSSSNGKKIFAPEEGEYVEFEEIP